MSALKIVYFGTPDFAAYILQKLVEAGEDIRGVVTMPDKPSGRGHRLTPSAVKIKAKKLLPDTPLLQPEKLRDEGFLSTLKKLDADLFIVVAFRMMPHEVWSMPERGTFNLHASLLPRYRGAAPIQHAILNGETSTGVTTFFLNEEIDQGRIILRKEVVIDEDETGGSLHDKLMHIGSDAVLDTIDLIGKTSPSTLIGKKQEEYSCRNELPLPTAPKIFKEDRVLNFRKNDSHSLYKRVRAMSPYPSAVMIHEDGTEYKVFKALPSPSLEELSPGDYIITPDRHLFIQCLSGALEIIELQAPSKNKRLTTEYLLGNSLPDGRFL